MTKGKSNTGAEEKRRGEKRRGKERRGEKMCIIHFKRYIELFKRQKHIRSLLPQRRAC